MAPNHNFEFCAKFGNKLNTGRKTFQEILILIDFELETPFFRSLRYLMRSGDIKCARWSKFSMPIKCPCLTSGYLRSHLLRSIWCVFPVIRLCTFWNVSKTWANHRRDLPRRPIEWYEMCWRVKNHPSSLSQLQYHGIFICFAKMTPKWFRCRNSCHLSCSEP